MNILLCHLNFKWYNIMYGIKYNKIILIPLIHRNLRRLKERGHWDVGVSEAIVYLNRCAVQTFELEYVRQKKLNYHICEQS